MKTENRHSMLLKKASPEIICAYETTKGVNLRLACQKSDRIKKWIRLIRLFFPVALTILAGFTCVSWAGIFNLMNVWTLAPLAIIALILLFIHEKLLVKFWIEEVVVESFMTTIKTFEVYPKTSSDETTALTLEGIKSSLISLAENILIEEEVGRAVSKLRKNISLICFLLKQEIVIEKARSIFEIAFDHQEYFGLNHPKQTIFARAKVSLEAWKASEPG